MKTVLFLCTGNYYRSRFAEYLFNKIASKQGLSWVSDSRGLALERGVYNIGAISKYAIAGLAERGVSLDLDIRYPIAVTESDFVTAIRIIALDEREHHPLMIERFPKWVDNIEYWQIHDVDKTAPEEALQKIADNIQELIGELGK
ncbi:arsenate-mycothiol transferase ArsC [Limnofasciculus baicalensis]|uniref:Low molecular weight phosphatase family protein n=1 Tax=Limnofasciculus baicalensis BBK-W-15 TaxID=2699891 RepID=A0AAE3GUY4_9CYAN|nr:low molecular weight phosphatase family protein [Limnofasciculus baicalensis]MCP2730839.1 low molecular weight phosphatase family protein [Limnofasciculus baicalensis BBK-W-15]